MLIPDVNILVGAFRQDSADHPRTRGWLERTLREGETVGLSTAVATATVRILTHPRIFVNPDSLSDAIGHIDLLRQNSAVQDLAPGPRHWEIFARLCGDADARGALAADAAHAAIAIEHGGTWVTLDRDFARFPGLRWEVPR